MSAAIRQESGEKTSVPKKTAMEKVTVCLCLLFSLVFIPYGWACLIIRVLECGLSVRKPAMPGLMMF